LLKILILDDGSEWWRGERERKSGRGEIDVRKEEATMEKEQEGDENWRNLTFYPERAFQRYVTQFIRPLFTLSLSLSLKPQLLRRHFSCFLKNGFHFLKNGHKILYKVPNRNKINYNERTRGRF
jgi:hypothetical protein